MNKPLVVGAKQEIASILADIETMSRTVRDRIYTEVIAVCEGRLVIESGWKAELAIYDYRVFQHVMGMPVVTRADPRMSPTNMFLSTDWMHAYAARLGGASGFLVREKEPRSGEFVGLVGFCQQAYANTMKSFFLAMTVKPSDPHFGATYHPYYA